MNHHWKSLESRQRSRSDWQNFALINGEVVAYDIAASTMNHGAAFADMVYLGKGTWNHAERVIPDSPGACSYPPPPMPWESPKSHGKRAQRKRAQAWGRR